MGLAPRKHEVPEVAILRDHDPSFMEATGEHLLVCRAPRGFEDGNDVVAGGPQGTDHREVAALVGEKQHLSAQAGQGPR